MHWKADSLQLSYQGSPISGARGKKKKEKKKLFLRSVDWDRALGAGVFWILTWVYTYEKLTSLGTEEVCTFLQVYLDF